MSDSNTRACYEQQGKTYEEPCLEKDQNLDQMSLFEAEWMSYSSTCTL